MPDSPTRGGSPLANLIGALTYGRRPEDAAARKSMRRIGLVGTLIAMLSWMPWLLVRGDNRIDRIIESQQKHMDEAISGVHRLAAAVEANTVENREMRTTLLEKIPDARPQPRPVQVKVQR